MALIEWPPFKRLKEEFSMGTPPKYLVAALCGLMILVACTAGCTSSTTSPSPQASASVQPSAGPSDKFTSLYDSRGSDPDPSAIPRYQPSVRVISPSNYSTGWVYHTKDSVSSVKAFYEAQMPKLGYRPSDTDDNTSDGWSVSFAKGNATVLISAGRPSYDDFTTISLGPTAAVQVTPIPA